MWMSAPVQISAVGRAFDDGIALARRSRGLVRNGAAMISRQLMLSVFAYGNRTGRPLSTMDGLQLLPSQLRW